MNPATVKDIETVAAKNNWEVFGVKAWEWDKVRGKDLPEVRTFGVDYIIHNNKEAEADKLIAEYKAEQKKIGDKFDSKIAWKVINGLADLALMQCTWV